MPLGFERINERQLRPNSRINFIKPLEGSSKEVALDFLNRIAAICYPIMVKNSIVVMSLEEFEPNMDFVGRNFNAGEVIQLVLKAPYTGHWLPFRHVQMVMMHELAHCKQMNHSGAFWKVRNNYADEIRQLWSKDYVGEGLWGRGKMLTTGSKSAETDLEKETLPSSLCGGTFRSNRRKRKRGPEKEKSKLSYAERKQRRIARKFGVNGVALGEDEVTKNKLENGKKIKGKPRVAGSARGRELRAAAALARFEKIKEESDCTTEDNLESSSDDDSDYESFDTTNEDDTGTTTNLRDAKGFNMVKVCENEDPDDDFVKQEVNELRNFGTSKKTDNPTAQAGPALLLAKDNKPQRQPSHSKQSTTKEQHIDKEIATKATCLLCSFDNEPNSFICMACSNVLDSHALSDTWKCQRNTCKDSKFLNSGDSGVCGICGRSQNNP
ncbi:MAG: hypothetical protein M1814_000868 [Vezdaea aestivalis]|nr:MAG: hypothetical protein M1814_000868 [Vezdaea aestivalis]